MFNRKHTTYQWIPSWSTKTAKICPLQFFVPQLAWCNYDSVIIDLKKKTQRTGLYESLMLRLLKAIMALVLEELWKTTTAVRKANVREEIWSRDLQNTIKEQKIQISDDVDDLLRRQHLENEDLRWSFTALIPTGGSVRFHSNWIRYWRCLTQINCPAGHCLPVMAIPLSVWKYNNGFPEDISELRHLKMKVQPGREM